MELWFYLVSAAFVILLIMYLVNARIDKQFRKKMVPLLKKQKSTIDDLESEKNNLSEKNLDLTRELNILNTKISKQDEEYDKIYWILQNTLITPLTGRDSGEEISTEKAKEKPDKEYSLKLAESADWWFRKKYRKEDKDLNELEITNLLNNLCNQLITEFDHKKLSFVQHTGEPVSVEADEKMLSQIFLSLARLLGERSVSGNTIYVDIEKTGKKCLVSLEDATHGPDDIEIKSLFTEIWHPEKLPDMDPGRMTPVILARELVSIHGGNVWHSRVYEVGIKITFSIPLYKSK